MSTIDATIEAIRQSQAQVQLRAGRILRKVSQPRMTAVRVEELAVEPAGEPVVEPCAEAQSTVLVTPTPITVPAAPWAKKTR